MPENTHLTSLHLNDNMIKKLYNAASLFIRECFMSLIFKSCIILLLIPSVSWGYIDPGSGSAIMSAIIGFFVAIGLVIKTFWYKIKAFFTGNKSTEDTDSED